MTIQRILFTAALTTAAVMVTPTAPLHAQDVATPSPAVANVVTGITAPSERLRLSLPFGGIVAERKVKPGQVVKKDQVLLTLDDRYEVATLKAAELEANSDHQVAAAKADLDLRKVQLERKEGLLKQKVASMSEVEEARLQVEIGAIRQSLQEQEKQTKTIERDRQKLKVELMRLTSPIDGEVEAIDVGPGEWADPQKPSGSVTVVKNDPLWVEVHLPTRQSQRLDHNAPLMVKYEDDAKATPAKIIYINPVADAASDTQLVRLELPNPTGRSSGLQVTVQLPDNVAAMAEGR
jgi:RND family efflux transporter MFP subunit